MSEFKQQLSEYPRRDTPLPSPSEADWATLEAYLKFRLPPDYKVFVTEAAGYYFDGEIPSGNFGDSDSSPSWLTITKREREESGNPIPNHFIPFCGVGNGDYHCFRILERETGAYDVVYWDHEILAGEQYEQPKKLAKSFREWVGGYVKNEF